MGTRIISGAIGAVIAALIIWLHDTLVLNFALAAIILLMLYELFKAARCIKLRLTCLPAFIYGAAMPFVVATDAAKYKFIFDLVLVFAVMATFVALHNSVKYYRMFFILGSTILVTNSMTTLIIMNEYPVHGLMYLIMGLCGAWLADTGAYFSGTFFGKHKLCPEVSPKKTVEGFAGGLIVTGGLFMLINFIYEKLLPKFTDYTVDVTYWKVFLLGVVLAVIGTVGDLSASVLKRQCGIKDYGNIMPGHGGAMDRFDSVLFVAPCLFAFISVINIYN